MALAADTVWECRTSATAGNLNGGGFSDSNKGATGVDYSQQDAAQKTWTAAGANNDLACVTGTSTLTSASGGFTDAMLGNLINITAGTNFTTGRYMVTGFTNANTVTLDRSPVGGVNGSAGTGYLGGALSSVNRVASEAIPVLVAGNTIWIKAGTYTAGTSTSGYTSGTNASPITFIGYNATRGDNPTSQANQPVFSQGAASTFRLAPKTIYRFITFTGSVSNMITSDDTTAMLYCHIQNTGTGSSFNDNSNPGLRHIFCDFTAPSGTAISMNNGLFFGCYFHDCKTVFSTSGGNTPVIAFCVFETCDSMGANSPTSPQVIGCTFYNIRSGYGAAVGVPSYLGNIFAYVRTALTSSASNNTPTSLFNNYFSNNTDVSNYVKGLGDIALDPQFTSGIVYNTDGTTNASPGTTFTSAGSNFTGVTTSDYLLVHAGTGATTGCYAISAVAPGGDTTKLTLSTSPGNSLSGVTFGVVKGTNFTPGTNMKAASFLGTIAGSLAQGYLDLGAIQRQEPNRQTTNTYGSPLINTYNY